ncbi:hypothetical protein BDV96DRAFT_609152 [Lophiotrema nucula]|uniref:Uncharacterized protein n=1 Tax=Lophiotrema nucula TaxID=690887 RepID=A0A6A5ZUY1_9PLEO|nr:hypothetical protein BDV96DRAFT_609152 [Lophiotrema nucula]
MSFFMATVPAGTQLYHGTWRNESVKGMEWLAFEPEHALIFARPRRSPPGDDKDGKGPGRPPHTFQEDGNVEGKKKGCSERKHEGGSHCFPPPPPNTNDDGDQKTGFLHTYAPQKALSLLYIDGMSAGKTTNGTLDSQDYLLLNLTDPEDPEHGGMFREWERAQGLCDLSATLWEYKIDGVLRMEGGFEIILCDFEKDLEVKSIMPVVDDGWPGAGRGMLGGWRYYQAIAERYHGIGGGRVVLDYEHFVTAYAYEGLNLFDNDGQSDTPMPRLENARQADLRTIKDAVTGMILTSAVEKVGDGTNWQAIADMIIQRYSAPLHHLTDKEAAARKSKEALATYLSTLLRPFIDYTSRNTSAETARCVAQHLPPVPPPLSPPLAYTALSSITSRICTSLLSALDITTTQSQPLSRSYSYSSSSPPPSPALELIDALTAYLRWTSWKQCGPCPAEQLCIIPIWPMGTFADHASPRCKAQGEVSGVNGYWGRWGPRGRQPPPPPEDGDRDRLEGLGMGF